MKLHEKPCHAFPCVQCIPWFPTPVPCPPKNLCVLCVLCGSKNRAMPPKNLRNLVICGCKKAEQCPPENLCVSALKKQNPKCHATDPKEVDGEHGYHETSLSVWQRTLFAPPLAHCQPLPHDIDAFCPKNVIPLPLLNNIQFSIPQRIMQKPNALIRQMGP